MDTDVWIKLLTDSRKMSTRKEVNSFENALTKLAEKPDYRILHDLFLVFDDKCMQSDVMWGLVHFIESFDFELVVKTLIEVTPQMMLNARSWTRILYTRLLNDESTKTHLKSLLVSQSKTLQQNIRQILEEIGGQDLKNPELELALIEKVKFVLEESN